MSRPSPVRDRARLELLRDHQRTDRAIAEAAGCSSLTAWIARARMVAAGEIPATPLTRTGRLRGDPELLTAPPLALAERHELTVTQVYRLRREARHAARVRRITSREAL